MINRKHTTKVLSGLLLLAASLITSCSKTDDFSDSIQSADARPSLDFLALTNTSQLLRYNSANSSQSVGGVISITGLQTSENIVAIDYRPATGQLYGLGMVGTTTARIYILPAALTTTSTSAASITARIVGTTITTTGGVAGFDFDPTTDKIRLVTTTGQNFLVDPETGVATSQTAITGGTNPKVTGVAFSNNVAGAATTDLYDLDVANQKIYKQTPATGAITEVGTTGLVALPSVEYLTGTNVATARTAAAGGFDIAPNGTALAVLMANSAPAIPLGGIVAENLVTGVKPIPAAAVSAATGTATLFKINLETGRATDLGVLIIPATTTATQIIGLAIAPSPVAYAINDADNKLLVFNPTNPGTPVAKAITGLQASETILGIDFRNSNGQLYALGSSSRLYTIDLGSGAATSTGLLPFTTALDGTSFGFEVNQAATPFIRTVSNTGQQLRISVAGAVTNVDAVIASATKMTGATYNSSGVLYTLDTETNNLYSQKTADANTATFTKVGKLGLTVDAANGFDIGLSSGTAYAILTTSSGTRLYQITLSTGLAVTPGVAFPSKVRGFTLAPGF
ncbi:MAG: DUF4394 domain-containing protein [Sphingobacteriaceae bacterium]